MPNTHPLVHLSLVAPQILKMYLAGGLLALLAKFRFGRRLLLRFPRFFTWGMASHAGPSQEQMDKVISLLIYRCIVGLPLQSLSIDRHRERAAKQPRSTPAQARFEVLLYGHGYRSGPPATADQAPDRHVVCRVAGPDPGYLGCSTMLVQVGCLSIPHDHRFCSRLFSFSLAS